MKHQCSGKGVLNILMSKVIGKHVSTGGSSSLHILSISDCATAEHSLKSSTNSSVVSSGIVLSDLLLMFLWYDVPDSHLYTHVDDYNSHTGGNWQ